MTFHDRLTALERFRFPLTSGLTLEQAIRRQSNDDSDAGGCPGRTAAVMHAYRRFLALAADAPGGTITVPATLANLHARYERHARDPGALEVLLGTPVRFRRVRCLRPRDPAYEGSRVRYRGAFGEDPHPRIAPPSERLFLAGMTSLAFIPGLAGGILTVLAKPQSPAWLVLSLLLILTGGVSIVFFKAWHIPDAD